MKKVVLVHQQEIWHYRVAIYNKLSAYLRERGWSLVVVAAGVQRDSPHPILFELRKAASKTRLVLSAVLGEQPDAVILWLNLRNQYLFPLLLTLKSRGIPAIYWGHGCDLEHKGTIIRQLVAGFLTKLELTLCDAVIIYSDNQRHLIAQRLHGKLFVARNTIDTSLLRFSGIPPAEILAKHGIGTRKNIICVGRLQRRKRIGDLVAAFERIPGDDCGLILVGPDVENCVGDVKHPRVYKLGPLFGDQVTPLLEAANVYCMPGHVGLGIVDAMFYGLPFVTQDVPHAPEIMFLKDGVNGFIVPAGKIDALAAKLQELLHDDGKRAQFSEAARRTIMQEASIEIMFKGFEEALNFVTRRQSAPALPRESP